MAVSVGTIADALATAFGVGIDLAGLFAPKADTTPNVVRIYAGAQRPEDSSLKDGPGGSPGGNAPGVSIWDVSGKLIGTLQGDGKISDDNLKDYAFDTGSDQRGAEYISVSASGTDGLCIASIALTTPDNNNYAWFGDTARYCGAPWYFSNHRLGGKVPNCAWIDTNADKGHKYNGLSVHMPSFANTGYQPEQMVDREKQLESNTALMCKSKARFTMWDNIIPENDIFVFGRTLLMTDGPDTEADQKVVLDPNSWFVSETGTIEGRVGVGGITEKAASVCAPHPDDCHPSGPSSEEDLKEQDITKRRRGLPRRQESSARVMPDDLVITSMPEHTASELCGDPTSEGPDLVSLVENMFCDMSTQGNRKQLYPLCSQDAETNCFDMQSYDLRTLPVLGSISPKNGTNTNVTSSAASLNVQKAAKVADTASSRYTRIQNWNS